MSAKQLQTFVNVFLGNCGYCACLCISSLDLNQPLPAHMQMQLRVVSCRTPVTLVFLAYKLSSCRPVQDRKCYFKREL